MVDTVVYARGQIYWRLPPSRFDANIAAKRRPVLIVSNNVGNHFSGIVTVVPLTTKSSHNHLPTHITIDLPNATSYLMAEQITTVNKKTLSEYIATVTPEKMVEVDEAIQVALGFKCVDDAEYVNKAENCVCDSRVKDEHVSNSLCYKIEDKIDADTLHKLKNSVSESTTPRSRHRYTQEEKLQFVVDYDSVKRKQMTREEFMRKYTLTCWGSAQSMNSRFRKKLEV